LPLPFGLIIYRTMTCGLDQSNVFRAGLSGKTGIGKTPGGLQDKKINLKGALDCPDKWIKVKK
jgi:hypothetical protein